MAAIDKASGKPAQGSQLPTLVIGAVFLVVAIIFAASSDWYDTFLAVHILAVVIWVGGGLFLTVMALLAERTNDAGQLASLAKMAAFAGHRIFAPASLIVLAMGIAMVENAGFGFDHFWIGFGFIGFLITFVLGIAVLAPRAKNLDELVQTKGVEAPETQAAIANLLLIARADVAMLLLVIVDMVAKPFS